MNRGIVIFIIGFLLVGGFLLLSNKMPASLQKAMSDRQPKTMQQDFVTPKKSAHYESSTPGHGSVMAAVPINVVIDVNFDLVAPSEIKIIKDGTDSGVGETVIDANKLAMRRTMNPNSPDGVYTVEYNACWPDKTCHDGYFQFAIDRTTTADYQDMTGQAEVTVSLSQIQFMPMNIKVTKGTTITWVNDDEVEHYVNTDSHPAHTYYPAQNSRALAKGQSFSNTFNTTGVYPYHCSAHEATMKGSIIVE